MHSTFKRLMSALAVSVTVMMGVVVGATPAKAAASDCPTNYFCLFHWVDYQGGRWQVNTDAYSGACWNYGDSKYSDGYVVNNTSASMVDRSGSFLTIRLYDWVNCNEDGAKMDFVLGGRAQVANLNSIGWYHRFTSFKLIR